jgi:hypothetical protein
MIVGDVNYAIRTTNTHLNVLLMTALSMIMQRLMRLASRAGIGYLIITMP